MEKFIEGYQSNFDPISWAAYRGWKSANCFWRVA